MQFSLRDFVYLQHVTTFHEANKAKPLEPLLRQHGLILVPVWTSNHIKYKEWNEITYPFPNFNDAAVEVWEWIYVISFHTLLSMWLLIHAGI